MIDKMSQTQSVHVLFIYLQGRVFKGDYMFRPSSLGHHQVISLYRGNYTIYDTIFDIKSLLFKLFNNCCSNNNDLMIVVQTTIKSLLFEERFNHCCSNNDLIIVVQTTI